MLTTALNSLAINLVAAARRPAGRKYPTERYVPEDGSIRVYSDSGLISVVKFPGNVEVHFEPNAQGGVNLSKILRRGRKVLNAAEVAADDPRFSRSVALEHRFSEDRILRVHRTGLVEVVIPSVWLGPDIVVSRLAPSGVHRILERRGVKGRSIGVRS